MWLIEYCKRALDKNVQVGAILIDLSKALDCILYDLLIVKLHTFGLSEEATKFLYS